jgi:uncharacterized protein with LGFP repeats
MKGVLAYVLGVAFFLSTSSVSAFQVYGAIGEKWRQLGAESGPLGAARNDERDAARGGRYNDFQFGFIYWHPSIGAHAVYGLIGEKWNKLGRERGFGYPLTDEQPARNGGRYNDFENGGSIYWHPRTGAHVVYGAIGEKWRSMGRERSMHGYPKTDEYSEAGGFRRVDFDCGYIRWSPKTGARSGGCSIIDHGTALNPVRE